MHDDEQPIEDAAQRVLGGEREISLRVEEDVHGGRHGAAAAVPKDHDELEAVAEVVDRVLEAAEHLAAEAVAGDADDEEIVRPLVEDELDRHARVGAPEHRGVGSLARRALVALRDAEIARVHGDDPPRRAGSLGQAFEQRRERPASFVEAAPRGIRVGGPGSTGGSTAVVSIGDLDDFQLSPARCR